MTTASDIAERARRIAAENFPGVPFRVICSWVYSRTLDDGPYEYVCSQCGDTQIVQDMIGEMETRTCRGTHA
jgi:hypothetical protein